MMHRTNTGFTLIELLLYIAITLIAGVVAISGIVSFGRALAQYKLTEDLSHSATFVLEHLVRDVRHAGAVDVAQSVFDDPAGVLVLSYELSDGSSVDHRWDVAGGVVRRAVASGTPSPHSRSSVSVTSFTVSHVANGISEGVQVSLTLSATRGGLTKEQSLQTFVVTRNSYQ
jgi:type II secretory pathway pseudopilin PulG